MKKKLMAVTLFASVAFSLAAYGGETEGNNNVNGGSVEEFSVSSADTAAVTEQAPETEGSSKTAHLLADGYELMEYLTLPVRLSNQDLDVENLEPENAEKLTIDGAQGEGAYGLRK